jgi:type I restriction enzyme S subunit
LDKHSFPNGKRLVRDTLKPDDNLHYEKFSDGTVKCIEDEIPFELPEGWEWTRLGCITDVIQYGLSNSAESTGNYRLLRITDIQNGCVNWDTVPFTSTDEPEKYLLHKDDIVFARTGATVGKSFLITDLPYASVYASYLIRIRLINGISANYIYHFFNSYCYWEQVTDKAVGVGQPNCNGTALRELFIPLPSQAEQIRIVPVTDNLLKIVDTITSEQESLSELIQTTKSKILDLAIRGKLVAQDPNDEPASVLLKRIRAEKEELIKQGKIKRDKKESVIFKGDDNSYYEKYGEKLPSGWVVTNFETLLSYEQPTNYIVKDTNYKSKYETPVLTAGKSFILGYTDEKENIFSELPVIIFDDFTTESKFVDFPFKVKSSAMKILHINTDLVLPKFAFYLMQATQIDHDNHQRYWISTYSQEEIALPPLKEQERILSALEQYFKLLNCLL